MSTTAQPWADPQQQHRHFGSPALLRWGQHLVTFILVLIVLLRVFASGQHPWLSLGLSILFVAWYSAGFIRMARSQAKHLPAWWLAVLLVIWVASLASSPEFMWLAFSLWLLLGHQLPLLPSILWSVVVYAFTLLAPYLHNLEVTLAAAAGPLVGGLFAWGISRGDLQMERDAEVRTSLVDSLVRAQQEMADLQGELARSQHEAGIATERTRLAREIHDTVAQQLSSIGLHAKAAEASKDPAAATVALSRIDELSGQALTDLRRIIAALARQNSIPRRSPVPWVVSWRTSRQIRSCRPVWISSRGYPRCIPMCRSRCCALPSPHCPMCCATPRLLRWRSAWAPAATRYVWILSMTVSASFRTLAARRPVRTPAGSA